MWKLESQSFHPYWPRWDLNFRFIHCLSVTLPTFCPSEALVLDHVSVWKPRWSDGAELEGQSYSQRPRGTVVQWGCRVGCPCQGCLFAVICLCGAWVFTTFHCRIHAFLREIDYPLEGVISCSFGQDGFVCQTRNLCLGVNRISKLKGSLSLLGQRPCVLCVRDGTKRFPQISSFLSVELGG